MVERSPEKAGVGGSIPSLATTESIPELSGNIRPPRPGPGTVGFGTRNGGSPVRYRGGIAPGALARFALRHAIAAAGIIPGMRRLSLWILLGCSQCWCEPPKLVPAPRRLIAGEGELRLRAPVRIYVAQPEDRLAGETLVAELRETHGLLAAAGPPTGGAQILLLRAGDAAAESEMARLQLDREALKHDEGYLLHSDAGRALVIARTAAGVFYGAQTLRQLIGPGGRLPAVSIADWPALRYRGLSVDVSRGPIPNGAQLERLVRIAAEFKLNMLSLYMEHVFAYRHAPLIAPEGGEFTRAMVAELSGLARRHHIELVPQQQTFGHLHHMLKFERYAPLAEIPHGSVLTPAEKATYVWIEQSCRQLAEAFPGTFLHIGSDETWELGQGRSRAEAERIGVGRLYVRHMQRVAEMLRPLNRRLMFWGDIALRHAELIPELPRDLVAMTWTYDPRESFADYIEPFRQAGFAFFVCPGLNNWNRVFPNVSNALANIAGFVRDGKRAGALGMFNTHWADDGEALLNHNWYGILYSAAAAWQEREPSPEEFHASFDWAFYRNTDPTFAEAVRRLDEAHRILRRAGISEASNRAFWLDPFAPAGAALTAQLAPVAGELRLAAEDALAILEAADNKARRNRESLLSLKLAAKRLDYLGMKVQYGLRIGEIYREAVQARVPRNFGRINSTNGMLQDLRDYATELRDLYRRAWLVENRPYWLDNVLVRYDDEALLWTRRIRLFTDAVQQYQHWQRLPPPGELGLHLP